MYRCTKVARPLYKQSTRSHNYELNLYSNSRLVDSTNSIGLIFLHICNSEPCNSCSKELSVVVSIGIDTMNIFPCKRPRSLASSARSKIKHMWGVTKIDQGCSFINNNDRGERRRIPEIKQHKTPTVCYRLLK